MTSSAEPEVHNVSQRHQRRTNHGHRQQTHNDLVKFGLIDFELCERRDRQTDILIAILCTQYFASLPGGRNIISSGQLCILSFHLSAIVYERVRKPWPKHAKTRLLANHICTVKQVCRPSHRRNEKYAGRIGPH